MNITELNRITRCALGPEAWADGVWAAICCGADDEQIRQSIAAASNDERMALAHRVIDTRLLEHLKGNKPFQGGSFTRSVF